MHKWRKEEKNMYQLSDPVWIGWIRGDYGYIYRRKPNYYNFGTCCG